MYLKRGATLVLAAVLGTKVFGEGMESWEQRVQTLCRRVAAPASPMRGVARADEDGDGDRLSPQSSSAAGTAGAGFAEAPSPKKPAARVLGSRESARPKTSPSKEGHRTSSSSLPAGRAAPTPSSSSAVRTRIRVMHASALQKPVPALFPVLTNHGRSASPRAVGLAPPPGSPGSVDRRRASFDHKPAVPAVRKPSIRETLVAGLASLDAAVIPKAVSPIRGSTGSAFSCGSSQRRNKAAVNSTPIGAGSESKAFATSSASSLGKGGSLEGGLPLL